MQIGFGEYKKVFGESKITGKLLLSLTKLDLKTLTVNKLGHRLRFLKCLEQLKVCSAYAKPSTDNLIVNYCNTQQEDSDSFGEGSLYDDTLSSVDSTLSSKVPSFSSSH